MIIHHPTRLFVPVLGHLRDPPTPFREFVRLRQLIKQAVKIGVAHPASEYRFARSGKTSEFLRVLLSVAN